MKIEILYFEGCPNHEEAERRVRDVLGELKQDAEIVRVDVPDDTTAARVRFPGSPTIRVDGEDVVPEGAQDSYTLRCRIYRNASGLEGAPEKDAIRAAVQRRPV